jgi:glycosyltransferase involved in cell wall biosynthesis
VPALLETPETCLDSIPTNGDGRTVRVIVYPHDLDMGGSQLNAIEISAAVRDLGVEATIFGQRGDLNNRIAELGLEFVEAPRPRHRPSRAVAEALRRTAKHRGATVLHGYEWPPALECYIASAGLQSAVAVSTVMSMSVAPFIPRKMPLLVGTEQIAHAERIAGRRAVAVLEPPVDLAHNAPLPEAERMSFRRQYGIDSEDFLLVSVSRLARELKAEGLITAISATADLPCSWRVRLIIVGDGPARDEIHRAAAEANSRAGRPIVTLVGQLMDPRAAYAAADAVLGMGGSALRALAYSRPLIVQGEKGFFSLLDERSAPTFLWQGWYGVGLDAAEGSVAFTQIVHHLASSPELCRSVGAMGRKLVVDRFSLAAAARRQVEMYEIAGRDRPGTARLAASATRALPAYACYQGGKKMRRVLRRAATDDFNTKPVAATAIPRFGLDPNSSANSDADEWSLLGRSHGSAATEGGP